MAKFNSNNGITVYWAPEVKDIKEAYKEFLMEESDLYFNRHRRINFSLDEFNALNLTLRLGDKEDVFQICKNLGLPTHIDYEALIQRQVIDCGFLEGVNYFYSILKNRYKVVKIDLPETHLHSSIIISVLDFIKTKCDKLIIFTYSPTIVNVLHLGIQEDDDD